METQKIKQIFEREIKRHSKEIDRHREMYEIRNSKQQLKKMQKHFHKRFQTILLAKNLGFTFCECCGTLLTRQKKKDRDDGSNVFLSGTPKQLVGKNNKDEHMPSSADTHSAEKHLFVEDDIFSRMQYKDAIHKKAYDDYTDGLYKW